VNPRRAGSAGILEKRITQRKQLFLGNSIAKREFAIHQSAIANPNSRNPIPIRNPIHNANPQSTIRNPASHENQIRIRNPQSQGPPSDQC
jgi:hypothetical protein